MPAIRQYSEVTTLLPTDAFVIDRIGMGTMYCVLSQIGNVAVFTPLATAPSSPTEGLAYFDTTLGYPRVWSGTAWLGILLS